MIAYAGSARSQLRAFGAQLIGTPLVLPGSLLRQSSYK
jgi:hypothetical protein